MEIELREPLIINGPGVLVRTGDDVRIRVPDPIKVTVTTADWSVDLTVRPDPVTLNPSLAEEVVIRQLGDRPIPLDVLRSLRMGRIVEDIVREHCIRYEKRGNRWVAENFKGDDPSPGEMRKVLTSRRGTVGQAEIDKAAEVYRAAVADGRRDATMAVAEALRLSRPTAARRVQRAREQGLLGPAAGTKAGEA